MKAEGYDILLPASYYNPGNCGVCNGQLQGSKGFLSVTVTKNKMLKLVQPLCMRCAGSVPLGESIDRKTIPAHIV